MVVTHQRVSVLLADPNEITRVGLRWLLSHDQRFCVVGEASANPSAIASQYHPDLIVLDPVRSGQFDLLLIEELHEAAPASHIAVLTAHFELHSYMSAVHAGIYGYFLPEFAALGEPFLDALVGIGRWGEGIADPSVAARFQASCGTALQVRDSSSGSDMLTDRELQVLTRLLHGLNHNEIAAELGIAHGTVDAHVYTICRKLGAGGPAQLGVIATKLGIA